MPFVTQSTQGKNRLNVRSTLSLIFTIGATVGFFMKLITPESFMTLVTMCVSWYFAKRSEDDKKE